MSRSAEVIEIFIIFTMFCSLVYSRKKTVYSALIGIIISLIFLVIDLIRYKKNQTKEMGILFLLLSDIFGVMAFIYALYY